MRRPAESLGFFLMLLQAADAVVQRATSAVTQASVIEMQWRDFREFSSGERERGAAIDDATRAAGVDRIFARLLPVAWRDFSGSRSLHWEVMLTDDDRPEARAFPSGQIVLAAPFIARFVHSDDELAFLLAHAMAHILLEHGRRGHEAAVPLTRAAGPVDVQAPG